MTEFDGDLRELIKDSLTRAFELVNEAMKESEDRYDRRLSAADTLVRLSTEARYMLRGDPDELPKELTLNLKVSDGRTVQGGETWKRLMSR